MKRKIGEEVTLKTLNETIDEFGRAKDGTIDCEFGIIPQMAYLLEKKHTITEIQEHNGIPCYTLDNMHWWFSEDMIKEEEEDNLTVVLVTKVNNKGGLIEDEWVLSKEMLERRKEEFKNDEKTRYIFKEMKIY